MTAYITEARNLAAKTTDAYSFDRYGEKEWGKAAQVLLARDFSPEEAEWVLRSKWMRWAADMAPTDQPTARDLIAFMDAPRNRATLAEARRLMAEEA